MIYNSFFGLNEEPFGVTPDPKFLYISPKHRDALDTLGYGISQKRGFILFTGEVGSGKTTTVRHLLDGLEEGDGVRTSVILNPKVGPVELLKLINQDFGLKGRARTVKGLTETLNRFLLEVHRQGETAVLVIDEAHEMNPESLEFMRLLSNLETDEDKLIQILLVGQPELTGLLQTERLRQLDQRVAVRFHLQPLSLKETADYIEHRLRVAGAETLSFPDSSVRIIHRFSRGVPRLINLLSDRVLLASYASGTLEPGPGLVKEAIKEFGTEEFKEAATAAKGIRVPAAVGAVVLALTVLLTYTTLQKFGFKDYPVVNLPSPTAEISSPVSAAVEKPAASIVLRPAFTKTPAATPSAAKKILPAKPAAPKKAVAEKPVVIAKVVKEKPAATKKAVAEKAVKEKPVEIAKVVKEKPAAPKKTVKENPVVIAKVVKEKPAATKKAVAEKPVETKKAAPASGGMAKGLYMAEGLYRTPSAQQSEEASYRNVMQAWGADGLDNTGFERLAEAGDFTTYGFTDFGKIARFGVPVVLRIKEDGEVRHVALRSIVDDFALLLDPASGRQIVSLDELRDSAVAVLLIYRSRFSGSADYLGINQALRQKGLLNAEPSARFSVQTRRALLLFQTLNGLRKTGVADAETMILLSRGPTNPTLNP